MKSRQALARLGGTAPSATSCAAPETARVMESSRGDSGSAGTAAGCGRAMGSRCRAGRVPHCARTARPAHRPSRRTTADRRPPPRRRRPRRPRLARPPAAAPAVRAGPSTRVRPVRDAMPCCRRGARPPATPKSLPPAPHIGRRPGAGAPRCRDGGPIQQIAYLSHDHQGEVARAGKPRSHEALEPVIPRRHWTAERWMSRRRPRGGSASRSGPVTFRAAGGRGGGGQQRLGHAEQGQRNARAPRPSRRCRTRHRGAKQSGGRERVQHDSVEPAAPVVSGAASIARHRPAVPGRGPSVTHQRQDQLVITGACGACGDPRPGPARLWRGPAAATAGRVRRGATPPEPIGQAAAQPGAAQRSGVQNLVRRCRASAEAGPGTISTPAGASQRERRIQAARAPACRWPPKRGVTAAQRPSLIARVVAAPTRLVVAGPNSATRNPARSPSRSACSRLRHPQGGEDGVASIAARPGQARGTEA